MLVNLFQANLIQHNEGKLPSSGWREKKTIFLLTGSRLIEISSRVEKKAEVP